MEVEWMRKRHQLWHLLQDDQTDTDANLARQLGMSRAWIQKWRVRLVNADPKNLDDFSSQPRCRHNSPSRITDALRVKIIHYRETLTEQYHRRVEARNIP